MLNRSIGDPADSKGTSSRKQVTHFRFPCPTILSDTPAEMQSKIHLGRKFPCDWKCHHFHCSHAVKTMCEILYQLLTACLCSENIKSYRCRDCSRNTDLSSLSGLHFPSLFSLCRTHSEQKQKGERPLKQRVTGNKKTLKQDLFLLRSSNINSIPPCFSPSTIFNTARASLDGEGTSGTGISTERYWNLDACTGSLSS